MNKMNFPTDTQLDKLPVNSTISKWRDLQQDTWYRIVDRMDRHTKIGNSTSLKLIDRDGNSVSVWAPKFLASQLCNDKTLNYVKPLGLKQSEQNPNRHYHDFHVVSHQSRSCRVEGEKDDHLAGQYGCPGCGADYEEDHLYGCSFKPDTTDHIENTIAEAVQNLPPLNLGQFGNGGY